MRVPRIATFLPALLLSLSIPLLGVAVASGQTTDVAPDDCSSCKARLERALEALAAAEARNARLRERIDKVAKRLALCRADRAECKEKLERKHGLLRECRENLGRCRDAFGDCREKLAECRGGVCCDPAEEPGAFGNPFCFEGATCCDDGVWRCNRGDGSSSCGGGPGRVCEHCCDPADEPGAFGNPFCFEGATCCADGTWSCNEGDGSSTCGTPPGRVCKPACVPLQTADLDRAGAVALAERPALCVEVLP